MSFVFFLKNFRASNGSKKISKSSKSNMGRSSLKSDERRKANRNERRDIKQVLSGDVDVEDLEEIDLDEFGKLAKINVK